MSKLFAAAALAVCLVATPSANAAPERTAAAAPVAPPPPVESMDCDAMIAEMTAAGQKMSSQMDPEFAAEAKAMAKDAQASAGKAMAAAFNPMCMIPGLGMLCAFQQPTSGQEDAEKNIARMEAQMARMEKAMEGLDVERLQAMSTRFEAESCKMPEAQQ